MIISFKGNTGGGGYVLPPATTTTLGGVKVGSGLTIDSGGTLSNDTVPIYILRNQEASYYSNIMNYVIANSGNTSFIFYIDNDNGSDPGWFVATYWLLGSQGSTLFFNVYEGVSNPIGRVFYMTQSGFYEHHSNQLMSKPNSSQYSPFMAKLHLSSAETLYFENRQVDTGGTYDNILSTWGSLIFVGAYDMLKDVTQPYDCPICPLYVDSSSTDSGRTLAFPEIIDEPTDGSIIHNGEVADHKITLVYDEYKVSYYCGGSHEWIVGLTVTQNPITKFWKGTQAQYDALAPNYDNNTLYVIV